MTIPSGSGVPAPMLKVCVLKLCFIDIIMMGLWDFFQVMK